MQPDDDTLRDIHRRMVRIRVFETEAGRMAEAGRIPGALHLYVGQEAVAAGIMVHLTADDWITSTHRGHGHLIAKGGAFDRMFAELFGRATGYCGGKGGSMHISNMELGMLGANGIVGAGPPIAVGAAFTAKYRKTDRVAVTFFGDGASNEGSFHEAANMAALYKLPALFVCENNGYGEYTAQANHQAIVDVADRAAGYGMPGVIVDGMDAVAVYEAAVPRSNVPDPAEGRRCSNARRTASSTMWAYAAWGSRTAPMPNSRSGRSATRSTCSRRGWRNLGVLTQEQAAEVHDGIMAEVQAGIEFAEKSPVPHVDTLLDDVYA